MCPVRPSQADAGSTHPVARTVVGGRRRGEMLAGRDKFCYGGAYDIKRLCSSPMPGRVVTYVQQQAQSLSGVQPFGTLGV